ncbi:MAG: winged helix DNA-binding domain-containing protein [Actinomycetota bacterium]|nr:winged helix DNA-binding domain-containing protein [Actinomycetota bacterium]
MTSLHEVALLRLVAQRIAGRAVATATEAVRELTALQAQDLPGVLTSVALRTTSRSRQAVEDALDAGEVVRSWPMRGTLHLVVAEDLPWMLQLAAPRVLAGAATRRAELGLDTATLERARDVAEVALAGGRRLTRDEMLETWTEGGVAATGPRGYHLLFHQAQTGVLCFGPMRGCEQLVVLVDEWIPQPRRLERAEALGEWVERYFRSHGPATVKDFTRWTNLVAADVRAGLALARPQLASIDVEGVEHLMDPRIPDLFDACRREARGTFPAPRVRRVHPRLRRPAGDPAHRVRDSHRPRRQRRVPAHRRHRRPSRRHLEGRRPRGEAHARSDAVHVVPG